MKYITVPSDFSSSLASANGPIELRDQQGKVMGVFTPSEPPLTEEEVRKIFDIEKAKEILAREGKQGSSLSEIWERIEARAEGSGR